MPLSRDLYMEAFLGYRALLLEIMCWFYCQGQNAGNEIAMLQHEVRGGASAKKEKVSSERG